MPAPRPNPFDLVFRDSAGPTFQQVRTAFDRSGHDPRDRDAFLMIREVIELLRELRPAEGLGEGIDQLAALVHHCYLYWNAGCRTVQYGQDRLITLLGERPIEPSHEPLSAYYAQLPEHRIWAQAVPGEPPEPMDGCFVSGSPDAESLRVLAVFGLHRERAGFSVVEVAGRRPTSLLRLDGSALFSSTLPGGIAAGLFSLTGEEELLELGWRTGAGAEEAAVEVARWRA